MTLPDAWWNKLLVYCMSWGYFICFYLPCQDGQLYVLLLLRKSCHWERWDRFTDRNVATEPRLVECEGRHLQILENNSRTSERFLGPSTCSLLNSWPNCSSCKLVAWLTLSFCLCSQSLHHSFFLHFLVHTVLQLKCCIEQAFWLFVFLLSVHHDYGVLHQMLSITACLLNLHFTKTCVVSSHQLQTLSVRVETKVYNIIWWQFFKLDLSKTLSKGPTDLS